MALIIRIYYFRVSQGVQRHCPLRTSTRSPAGRYIFQPTLNYSVFLKKVKKKRHHVYSSLSFKCLLIH